MPPTQPLLEPPVIDAWDAVLAGVFAFVLSFVLVPAVRMLALAFNVVDRPEARRVHTQATPRLGGIAVMIATILSTTLCLFYDRSALVTVLPHLALACMLLAVGTADDVNGLQPFLKLGGTIVAAAIAAQLGLRIETVSLPWGPSISVGIFAVPLTVFWIVAVCHAVNLIDGLDGLAGTIALVAALGAAFTRIQTNRTAPAVVALALAGALLGFLRWNWTPAKIFLGDAGSLGIGGLLAVLALVPTDRGGSVVRVLDVSSLLLIAYPIADTSLAVLRRWLRGVPISVADRGHIHHRLLDAGHRQPRPTLLLGAWSVGAVVIGLTLRHTADPTLRLAGFALGASLLFAALVMLRRLGVRELQALACSFESMRRTWRRAIRDHILTSDAAEQLQRASTLDDVDASLTDCSRRVGLLGAELTRSSARRGMTETASDRGPVAVWSLDWPLRELPGPNDDPIVLRIYGSANGVVRPHTAARAAEALLPAIGAWLTLPRQRELMERRPASRRGRRASEPPMDALQQEPQMRTGA